MSTVLDILATKGDTLVSVGPDATVLNAAIVMNEHRIGSVAVMDQGRIVGMFTERDVLQRIVAQQREPATTRVGDVMSTEVVCCTPETRRHATPCGIAASAVCLLWPGTARCSA
jgi:CBS domain-containing protein